MVSFRQEDYRYYGEYRCPLAYYWLCQNWADTSQGHSFPELDGRLAILDGHLFFWRKDWDALCQATEHALAADNENFFQELFRLADKRIRDVLAQSASLSDEPASLARFFKAVHALQFPWFMMVPIGLAVEQSGHAPSFAMGPIPKTPGQRRLADLLRLRHLAGRERQDGISLHLETYAWHGMMHFWGTPLTRQGVLEELAANRSQPPLATEGTTTLLATLSFWRNYIAEACAMASLAFAGVADKLEGRTGLKKGSLLWMTPAEIMVLTEKGQGVETKTLDRREQAYGLADTAAHEAYLLDGQELRAALAELLEQPAEMTALKGMAANKGWAVGRAVIVRQPSDLAKVKEGDVLISPETTPDLIPAFYKVCAIVTDMGGLTSHAAVMSREFGLPCVIGTKVASRVVVDGDKVEVDAETGVVHIRQAGA